MPARISEVVKFAPSLEPQRSAGRYPHPRHNHKRYLAGALHAQSRRVVWVEERKDSALFSALLQALCQRYRGSREFVFILEALLSYLRPRLSRNS